MLGVPAEQAEQALTEVKNKMQPSGSHPITKEQLIGAWLNEKGSISFSEQIALGFSYDKLSNHNAWHPASELPPLNESLNSVPLVVICEHHGRRTLPKYACIAEGLWTEPYVKWWCYPPIDE